MFFLYLKTFSGFNNDEICIQGTNSALYGLLKYVCAYEPIFLKICIMYFIVITKIEYWNTKWTWVLLKSNTDIHIN